MACSSNALAGIALDCGANGGLSAVYISKYSNVSGITLGANDVITGITMSGGTKFVQYSFRKGNANYDFKGTKDVKIGVNFFTTTLNMQFNRLDQTKRKELQELFNSDIYVIVKDNNGDFWFLFYDASVQEFGNVTQYDGASGAIRTDGSFYTIAATGETTNAPYSVASNVMTSII